MRRAVRTAVAATVALGVALTLAAPAQAASPKVLITKVYYNAPGADTNKNASLNGEFVRLTNNRDYAINLKGWTVRDRANHVYTFTTNYTLAARDRMWIHTGTATNTPHHRYWGSGWHIWNNTGDKAYLRNASGTQVDTCTWTGGGSYKLC
jgi:hypothetical protein